jgi:hypothetical protein
VAIALVQNTGPLADADVAIVAPPAGRLWFVGACARTPSTCLVPPGWTGQEYVGVIGTNFVTAWKITTGAEGATFGLVSAGFSPSAVVGSLAEFSGFPLPSRVGTGNKQSNQPAADPAICATLTPPVPSEVILISNFSTDDSFESMDPTIVGGGFTQLANGHQAAGQPWFVNGYRIELAPAGAFGMQVHHRNSDGWGSGIEGVYAGVGVGGGFRGEPGGGIW